MKTVIFSLGLIINTNVAFAFSDNNLSLTDVDCRQNTCSSQIVNITNEKLGEFFLAKKVNPETGVSIYTAETINSVENITDSNLIVCLKNHECRLFKSTEGYQADYAYLNDNFLNDSVIHKEKNRSKRSLNNQINKKQFNLRADQIAIFEGNESLSVTFPNK